MYYLRLNIASPAPYYWSRPAQNWVSDPAGATLFPSLAEAEAEKEYAEAYGPGEVELCKKQASGG